MSPSEIADQNDGVITRVDHVLDLDAIALPWLQPVKPCGPHTLKADELYALSRYQRRRDYLDVHMGERRQRLDQSSGGPLVTKRCGQIGIAVRLERSDNLHVLLDIDALLAASAPDVEWTPAGPAAVERSVYRGREEIARGFESTWQGWEEFRLDAAEIRDLGQSVLWLGRATLRGAASHVRLDQEWAVVIAFTDRAVTSLGAFPEWWDALAAVGLEE